MDGLTVFISNLVAGAVAAVITSLAHNAIPLFLAIGTAVLMTVYVDVEKLKDFLLKRGSASVFASVVFGALTPLCACGTMAVIIGLLTTTLPWGPIMAFLTSSPLMSPDGFVMLAGVVGFRFAVALLLASIVIGLGSGFLTTVIERNTGFLRGQTRFDGTRASPAGKCGCASATPEKLSPVASACSCGTGVYADDEWKLPSLRLATRPASFSPSCCVLPVPTPVSVAPARESILAALKADRVATALVNVGLKQILLYFSIFVGIGFMINELIPEAFIVALFSGRSPFAIPIAAAIGLPLYVSGESAVPLIDALRRAGAGEGALLAFMITGQATSAWVIAGISTFMKRRAILLYLAFIVAGALMSGYLFSAYLALA